MPRIGLGSVRVVAVAYGLPSRRTNTELLDAFKSLSCSCWYYLQNHLICKLRETFSGSYSCDLVYVESAAGSLSGHAKGPLGIQVLG